MLSRSCVAARALSFALAAVVLGSVAAGAADFGWARRGGGSDWDGALALAVDPGGAIVVAGQLGRSDATFERTVVSGDNFLAKYSAVGNLLWVLPVVDGGSIEDVAVDPDGNILLTGSFRDTITIGATMLTSAGAQDFYLAQYDPDGDPVWAVGAGASADDKGLAVASDGVGNVIVSGEFSGTVSFPPYMVSSAGFIDGFLAKYTQGGAVSWVASEGEASNDRARGVTFDGDGHVYVTGDFSGRMFLARYTSGGTRSWGRTSSGSVALGIDVVADASGNALITGNFGGTASFGGFPVTSAGSRDVFVAKYDAEGTALWAER
ncbi:MAG: hypothetical protein QNK03_24555, partial [Myxococcota bacterium]|nr:hypothetical protein [Myxococcota bacterium]